MWKRDKNFPSRGGFSTPPPSWNSRPFRSPKMPLSDTKRSSPTSVLRSDLFHVIHKVPAGDSPYVKAKQVQLIDKDPGKAISLFWAAINAGDRVDSALKDMAIVMKQLDRSDEAIEAIKSFRHLCPYDSQESIDNVLVELYKRSGRIEEEIEMLQIKLKQIEVGTVFGGKRTKAARSQGKKVHITIEQEMARVLGNLAWAYLQLNNIIVAEGYYRKALSLEPDNNKKCNLAICLILMNRIPEAKSLIQSVRASCGAKQMEESFAKSFERALHMLEERERQFSLGSTGPEEDTREYHHRTHHEKEFFGVEDGGYQNGAAVSSHKWSKGSNMESLGTKKSNCPAKVKENHDGVMCFDGSSFRRIYPSPMAARKNVEAPHTQTKNCSWGFGNGHQPKGRWRNGVSKRKVLFENLTLNDNPQSVDDGNFDGEFVDITSECDEIGTTPNYKTKYCTAGPNAVELEVPFTQPRSCSWGFNGRNQPRRLSFENSISSENAHTVEPDQLTALWKQTGGRENEYSSFISKKSWADMVEEEEEEEEEKEREEEILTETAEEEEDCLVGDWSSSDEGFNDENLNSNIFHKNHSPNNSQLESDGIKDPEDAIMARNPAVRRPLYFDQQPRPESAENNCYEQENSGSLMRRNRLQIFQEITVQQESP